MTGRYLYTVIENTPAGLVTTQVLFGFRQTAGPPAPATTSAVLVAPTTGTISPTTTAVPVAPTTGTISPMTAPATAVPVAPATGTAMPLSTRFRLVALGFKAVAQTRDVDDTRDGHGDEVYLTAVANHTRLTGLPLPVTNPPGAMIVPVMTRTHGDEAVSVPYGRIKAGTASPNAHILINIG